MSGLAVATISTIIYTIAYIAREKYHKKENSSTRCTNIHLFYKCLVRCVST